MSTKDHGYTTTTKGPLHYIMFVARQKDNKDVEGYVTDRRECFVGKYTMDSPVLMRKFQHFVEDGVPGELCRFYYSVNSIDETKLRKSLLDYLLLTFDPDKTINFHMFERKIAGLALKQECAETKRWLFDFDIQDEVLVQEFVKDVKKEVAEAQKPKTKQKYKVPGKLVKVADLGTMLYVTVDVEAEDESVVTETMAKVAEMTKGSVTKVDSLFGFAFTVTKTEFIDKTEVEKFAVKMVKSVTVTEETKDPDTLVHLYPTPHGYAVVVDQGFRTAWFDKESETEQRTEFVKKWKIGLTDQEAQAEHSDISLKLDALLCYKWEYSK